MEITASVKLISTVLITKYVQRTNVHLGVRLCQARSQERNVTVVELDVRLETCVNIVHLHVGQMWTPVQASIVELSMSSSKHNHSTTLDGHKTLLQPILRKPTIYIFLDKVLPNMYLLFQYLIGPAITITAPACFCEANRALCKEGQICNNHNNTNMCSQPYDQCPEYPEVSDTEACACRNKSICVIGELCDENGDCRIPLHCEDPRPSYNQEIKVGKDFYNTHV